LVVGLRVLGVFCQALIFALLANMLSVADMGTFSAAYVFWGLVRMLGPLGLDQIGMREITRARTSGEQARAAAISGYATEVAAVAGLAIGLGSIVFLVATGASAHLSPAALFLIAAAAPAYSLAGVLSAALRYYDRNVASQAIESVGLHLLTLALLMAQWLLFGLSLDTVLLWQAVAGYGVAIVYAIMLRQAHGPDVSRLSAEARWQLRRESFEAWQALVLIGLAARAPTFISLTLLGPAATAILEIALRFGTLPTIITTGVSTTFAPVMASLHARNDRAALSDTLAVSSWLAFVPSACTLLGAVVLGPWLLGTFFPPVYQLAYLPLLMVIAATTVNAGFGMSSIVLFMTGQQRVVRVYSLLQLVAVLVLGCGLGYQFGVDGIACTVLIGFIVFDVGLALQVRPRLRVTGILRPNGLASLVRTLRGEPLAATAEESR
jgi:O-antigen/teichoic acid export membrane protein